MVAEEKIFKKEGMNHVDSVKYTDLYKVLTYLSWKNAKNDFENAVQEKIYEKNKIN
tara:strand:- start:1759 stop:1926 length:168 start_codon:yes stop_codon:yes gene_type:complete